MYIDGHSDHLETALRRLDAVAYTLNMVRSEIYDPQETDSRADLLIAAYGVANEACALLNEIKELVWPEPQTLETGQQEGN
jgi:hypothetical protein